MFALQAMNISEYWNANELAPYFRSRNKVVVVWNNKVYRVSK